MSTITKAIIPVAGFGTRFLPATKAQPKEMLTLVDKPVIQYIVEEAVAAGIKDIIFVTSQNKRAIEDHFDRNFELEYRLNKSKKYSALREIKKLTNLANFIYIRQKSPRGWGDAILAAKPVLDDEPFAYLSGDDVIDSKRPAIQQLMKVYDRYGDGVLGVTRVPRSHANQYGIIDPIRISKGVYQIKDILEKPKNPPSLLAVSGRYIFTPDIFSALKKTPMDAKGEVQGTDAIRLLLKKKPFYACEVEGNYYDCGSKLQFLQATVALGLKHKDVGAAFKRFLRTV